LKIAMKRISQPWSDAKIQQSTARLDPFKKSSKFQNAIPTKRFCTNNTICS